MKKVYSINSERSLRDGTRCAICGKYIGRNERLGKTICESACAYGGGKVYAHKHCLRMRSYGWNFSDEFDGGELKVNGRLSPSGFIIAPEWECDNEHTDEQRLRLFYRCGVIATYDCTVTAEYIARPYATLHAFKRWAATMRREAGAVSERCGTHLNFSTAKMREDAGAFRIKSHRRALFNPLRRKLTEMGAAERIRLFGSDFRHYANANVDYLCHEAFIGVRTIATNGRNCIEFRLPRAVSDEVANGCAFICKEWSEWLDKYLDRKITAEECGRQIAKAVDRYRRGESAWQKRAK